jgi:hypothetical protein
MDTPNKETMTKLAAMERGTANINRLIVANLRNYSELESVVQSFVSNPSEESAQRIDEQFDACARGFEAIRQAVSNVALVAFDADMTDDDGKLPISGEAEEDGLRLM